MKSAFRKDDADGCLTVLAEWVLGSTPGLDPKNVIRSVRPAEERLITTLGRRATSTDVVGRNLATWIGKVAERACEMQRETPLADDDLRFLKEGPKPIVELSGALTRRLTVFTSEVQYAEVKMSNALFSARTIKLPSEFQKIVDDKLRSGIKASLKIPVDAKKNYKILVAGKETHVSEDYLKRERASLEAAFLYDWKGRGKVIFRVDRDKYQAKLQGLVELTAAYQDAVKGDLDTMRQAFCQQMVEEFLPHWRSNPPARLRHLDKTDDQDLKDDIEERAVAMFNAAIEMGAPEAKDIYKDISIEDLDDEDMMKSLKDLMEKAKVPPATIAKLFRKDQAVGAGNGRDT